MELHEIPVKQYRLQYQPLGYAVSDWPPVSLHAANHHPASLAAQPSTHLTAPSLSLYFITVSMMTFTEILPKPRLKLKQCPLIFHHPLSWLSIVLEGYRACKASFPLHTNMLTAAGHLLFLCLEMDYRIICSITFPGIRVRITSQQLLDPLSCSSWRKESHLASFSPQELPPVAKSFQKLSGLIRPWCQPVSSALVIASCQVPWMSSLFQMLSL